MKKALLLTIATISIVSCGAPASLYYWGGGKYGTSLYEDLAYRHYDKQTPEVICSLVCLYEDMVSHPGGTRRVPPPGICAEYAYLLSQPETIDIFMANATPKQKRSFNTSDIGGYLSDRADELLKMEVSLYPESARFREPLIKKLKDR